MKKIIIVLVLILCCGVQQAYSTTEAKTKTKTKTQPKTVTQSKSKLTSSANSYTNLKQLADQYVSIELKETRGSKQTILKEMLTLGASNFKLSTYKPCPYRGMINIGGKTVNAKNKPCAEFKYTYKNAEYKVGRCGEAKK